MPCALCGRWEYRHKWHAQQRASPDPMWKCYYEDQVPGRFWYVTCKPNCEVNAVQEATNRINEWALWYWWESANLSTKLRKGVDAAMADLRRAHGERPVVEEP